MTPSAYRCSCAPGYTQGAGGSCSAGTGASLLLAHAGAVLRMDVHGRAPHRLANASAAGLDYHYRKNTLYWSDLTTNKIHAQPLTAAAGSGSESDISVGGSWSPVAVAVDWVGDKLYVADALGLKVYIRQHIRIAGIWYILKTDEPGSINLNTRFIKCYKNKYVYT